MALVGNTNEQKIWNYLKSKGLNDFGCAGLMGNLYAESGLKSQNVQNSYEKKLGYNDSSYTEAVDNGIYKNFVKDSVGYGIAQWTYWSRKQNLLDYVKSKGKSIGDLEAQLSFLYKELSESYKTVLNTLKTATSVLQASNAVLLKFERPADQSETMQNKRASYGNIYYNKYAKKSVNNGISNSQFKMRTSKPEAGNKYYITKANGGYSDAIKGKPTDADCDVLSNCVGYAYGRFNEIGGYGYCKYLCPVNAENFIQYKNTELEVGQTPKLGACMVWQKGKTLSRSDGAGHVAIVEKVISDTEVYTSESGYNSKPFWNQTRKKGDGNWGEKSSYKFLGFIYNPAVKDVSPIKPIPIKGNQKEKIYAVCPVCLKKFLPSKGCDCGKKTDNSQNVSSNINNTTSTKVKMDSAKSFSKSISGTYKTTSRLNMRTGAGTNKDILTVIPKGDKVTCYGYYTAVNNIKWFYVVFINNGIQYTGFVSSQYLSK